MKKIIRNKEQVKATKKFTDREQPRKVFWDEYHNMEKNLKNDEDIHVITYYGVGGIGKSLLLRQIEKELQEENGYYALYDFETAQDYKTVLSLLKKQLEEKYSFQFPLFDIALFLYAVKIGENIDRPEIQSLIEKSKTLTFIFDILEEIPGINVASKIFRLFDSGVSIFKDKSKNNKYKFNIDKRYESEIINLEKETADRIYKKLPYYFSQDLLINMEKMEKPLVILLDTYEKLVDEIKSEGYSLMKDYWLRNEDGPILQVPKVLWVIAGREKIKWGEHDKDWEETLNQHILGDLSFNDTNWFLQEAGIEEEKLRKELYELTNGTPVYLDICVDTYEILKENNEEIIIDKFGKNVEVLVERFIRYMDNQSSELVYVLSLIENWDDDMLKEFIYKILPNFSTTLYDKIKGLSFIFYENERYYMHKTVKDILQKECPENLKSNTYKELYNYYTESSCIFEYSVLDKNYMTNVDKYISIINTIFLESNSKEDSDIIDTNITNFASLINHLQKSCLIEKADEILNNFYLKVKENFKDSNEIYKLDYVYANMLLIKGKVTDGIEILENLIKELSENKIIDMFYLQNIVEEVLPYVEDDEKIIKNVLDYINKIDKKTLDDTSIGFLYFIKSSLYNSLGQEDIANEITKKCYELFNNKVEKDVYDKDNLMVSLSKLLQSNTKDENLFNKKLQYVKMIEKFLNNNKNAETMFLMNTLGAFYYELEDYEKALYWINKFEEEAKIQYNNQHNYLVDTSIIGYKLGCLDHLNSKNIKEYAITSKKYIEENYDIQDNDVKSTIENIMEYIEESPQKEIEEKNILYKIKNEGLNENNIKTYKKLMILVSYDLDLEEIIDFFNDYIEYCKKNYGEDSIEYLDSLEYKGYLYNRNEQFDEDLKIMEQVLKIVDKKYGENSLESAKYLKILGSIYSDLDENEIAKDYIKKSWDIYINISGEEDSKTLQTEYDYIFIEDDKEKLVIKLKEFYKKIVQIFGKEEIATFNVLEDIELTYINLDRYDEALKIDLELYKMYINNFSGTSKYVLDKEKNLLNVYFTLKKYDEFLKILEIHLKKTKKLNIKIEKNIIYMLGWIGRYYYDNEDYEKTLDIYIKSDKLFVENIGEDYEEKTDVLKRIKDCRKKFKEKNKNS